MLDIKHEAPDPVGRRDPEPGKFGEIERSPNTPEEDPAQAAAMAIITVWRDELRIKLARARLCFELIGLSTEEQDALRAEVGRFKELCALLRLLGGAQS
jgi:hypothetical protein